VVPLGYSFNLDGTNVYMTLATLFIAQAMGVSLSLVEQLEVLLVAMLTSKGASGVTGAGFICLASTLVAVRPELAPGMAMLLGIDKFMSECRALTNFCGNGVGAVVMSRWEKELDKETMLQTLGGRRGLSAPEASTEGGECAGPACDMHV
jgi:aerobic C4-dicarboxylate transport protein